MENSHILHLSAEDDKFCPLRETLFLSGFGSKSALYEYIGKDLFPKPHRISANRVAWSYREVQSWISKQKFSTLQDS